MTDETAAPAGAGETALAPTPTDLGNFLTKIREQPNEPAERAEPATAVKESPAEGDAARPEQDATGETQGVDPAEKPPLELPRSWTKDRTEYWNKLDPDTQSFLLDQDRKASAEVRRVQNEAADKLKGLTAKEQEVEKARQQYEARQLAPLDQVAILEYEQRQKFPDIKSMEDLQRIAAEATRLWPTDPITAGQLQSYLGEWRTHQDALAIAMSERNRIEGQKETERQGSWAKHVQEQMALATELIPELADKEKTASLIGRAEKEFLPQLGFSKSEIDDLSVGKQRLSIFDHRVLKMISDGMKYADIMAATKAVAAKPLPPVLRPGASKPNGSAQSDSIQNLSAKLKRSGETRDLAALIGAMRRA